MNKKSLRAGSLLGGLALSLGAAVLAVVPVADPPAFAAETGAAVADPIPQRTEGAGPYNRMVLRNAIIIDGTGAPAQGMVDIVIEGDTISEIAFLGEPKAIDNSRRPAAGDYDVDLGGAYVMPGFVDSHVHLHTLSDGQGVPSDYILKLWMSHGVTTVRDVGSGGRPIEWLVDVKERSAANQIVAPRIEIYPMFHDILGHMPNSAEEGRMAIRQAKERGADGVKFIGGPEDALLAAIDEAEKIGLHTTMHHAQPSVSYADVLDTSAAGLESMEHWYGLPEAMFTDRQLQKWPNDYVNNDEQARFGQAGRLWVQAAEPGSEKWEEVMDTLLERDFALSPTFTAYLTSRDFMRMSRARWHEDYTMPALWDWYRPSRTNHGSYWFDWTTEDEMAWKENYRLWMQFVNEYKNKGGLVTVGSDSGYIYNLYGFGYMQEMELLREAGFTPLEVIHAATQVGAEVLGVDDEVGTIRVGRKADLAIVEGNPLENMKLLFGTGALKLNDETGQVVRRGGIAYTVKDGILYDAGALRAEVRDMVAAAKAERGLPEGIMPIAHIDETE
ncbi:amidohydrolase [Pacificimonas flava]|uniref:Amidohydrolase n=2 Tax=Pacificimonas TaxID=1960290 RepID=A0A219B4A3_9SPHN|nr:MULTISPECIES: amidohydrolase family protein [Pacificimonas]MBZ6377714.1 amidohydrolase family protein [Pacificimonas aurantium]OWV32608.1 amidohydrolase [Pacificimonas flava]